MCFMNLARTPQQIGTIIRNARKARGWSQRVLGEKAGIRQGTVSQIETGAPLARLDTILAVLAALDLQFQVTDRNRSADTSIEDLF